MERNNNIDIIKGLGIILMVLGHCGFPFTHFIYLFHMPIFFIASGYCYNQKYSENISGVANICIKRLRSLYLPYVAFSIAYLLFWNTFIQLNIYTNNINFLTNGVGNGHGLVNKLSIHQMLKQMVLILFFLGNGGQMGGALWFLRCLFAVTIGYVIIDYILGKVILKYRALIHLVIGVVFMLVAFWLSKKGLKLQGLDLILATYVLFVLGTYLKNIKIPQNTFFINIVISISCFIALLICNVTGSIELSARIYTNPIFFIIASLSGWFLMYSLSGIINSNKLSGMFSYLGKNTIPIIGLHFLCFKLVSAFQLYVYKLPNYMLAGFPVLITKNIWWVLYAFVGITVPLLVNIPYQKMKKLLYRNKI